MTMMTERRPRRRHPAIGARIAAAGMATTAMLTMMAVLGYQSSQAQLAGTEAPAPATTPAPTATPITVVVYRRPAPVVVAGSTTSQGPVNVALTAAPVPDPAPAVTPETSTTSQPVQIQLQPSMSRVVQAPASTRTNGSR